jgi:hypothetical protein
VANPKSDPDYSVFITKQYYFFFQFYVPRKMSSRTFGVTRTPRWKPLDFYGGGPDCQGSTPENGKIFFSVASVA